MASGSRSKSTPHKRIFSLLVWIAAVALLTAVLRVVPLRPALAAMGRLAAWQIALLLIGNSLLLISFASRWWLILRALAQPLPYLHVALYRLAAYGVTYFTPGSQFGGEPLQVALIHRRHVVSLDQAAASVALEKLLEMGVNFAALAAGIVVTLRLVILGDLSRVALALSLVLLALPVGLLAALLSDRHPLSSILLRLPFKFDALREATERTEGLAASLLRRRPVTMIEALLVSGLNWVGILAEIWLMVTFLGISLTMGELIAIVTASRIAILLPSPGGLGTLEAGQVAIFDLLGLDPVLGLSLALLVRLRDVLFAGIGLAVGALLLPSLRKTDE